MSAGQSDIRLVGPEVTAELSPLLWNEPDLRICFAMMRRFRALVEAICTGPWLVVRCAGDEHLFEGLRQALLRHLTDRPELLEWGRIYIPDALPDAGEIDDWGWAVAADTAAAEDKIKRLAVPRQRYSEEPGPTTRFLAVDSAIRAIENHARLANKQYWVALRASTAPGDRSAGLPHTRRVSRRGRPAVKIPPERFSEIFWQMRDELHDEGETRDPTQDEVCERLTALGLRVGAATMRRILRDAGVQGWPPPRSWTTAA